jgi:signal transduction histidine kinase
VATQRAFEEELPTNDEEIPWFVRNGIPSRYVRFSVFPLPYRLTGEPLAQLTWEDITARKVAQQELQRAREGLEKAVENRTAQLKEANENLRHVEEELRKTNEVLEQRVRERTNELSKANESLRAEVVERKRTEEELIRAKALVEAASAARSEFLGNMSHELRTPLNHIIGFSELLVDRRVGELNEAQEEYLNDVLSSGRHLLSLISDILDLSKVETGEIGLNLTEVDLKSVLENSLRMVRQRAMKQGVELTQATDGIPDSIQADERKLKQIIYNLLSNAVKFTPAGGEVTLAAGLVAEDISSEGPGASRGRFVEISISDTGIGVRPADQTRIFAAFEQANGSAGRRYEGTGLGLALTKTLVELHGGKIGVESDGEGKGSKFSFTIPTSSILAVPEDPLAIRELQTEG